MINVLIGLLMFAGICVLTTLSIDIGIMAYHRATGTVTAEKVFEKIIEADKDTIRSQKNTINAQQSEIKIHKQRIKEYEQKLAEYEEEET